MTWQSHKTMPKNERVLVCYLNIWGYNHVTEAFWYEGEDYPTTWGGIRLICPFMWTEMPEGPNPIEWIDYTCSELV